MNLIAAMKQALPIAEESTVIVFTDTLKIASKVQCRWHHLHLVSLKPSKLSELLLSVSIQWRRIRNTREHY